MRTLTIAGVAFALLSGTGLKAQFLTPPHDDTNNIDCLACHTIHGDPEYDYETVEGNINLCKSCHNAAGVGEINTHSPGGVDLMCSTCHNPHAQDQEKFYGSTFSNLIRAVVTTPSSGDLPVILMAPSGANSFADGDAVYDGICEVCHTATTYHRNDATGDHTHNAGDDCRACHTHLDGYQPSGGGSCQGCHASPQDNGDGIPAGGRRAVVGEFAWSSHHVQGTLEDTDCTACHHMGQHQQGYVRLKDVDDPFNETKVVTLLDDPMSVPAEAAKLEAVCLACHDADGAGGSAPFGDGVMPPIVDATAWAAASHMNVGLMTCFGDGVFGCHASGHGSEKIGLLAPYDVPPTPPANAEEEEGFCFTCHDADGPAGSDVASRFAPAIRWVTDTVGDFNNIHLNDRHDVQYDAQLQSGAKVECVDCHDPHTANATWKLRLDPDPADGRIPGDGNTLPGADYQTEWCLDCHDGSFPAGITPPATALNNVLASYDVDAHGLPTGNPSLKPGYGWSAGDVLDCLACHTRDHVGSKTNLFATRDLVKSKDGLTDVPSDNFGLDYWLSDNSVKVPQINGFEWCNTCHANSMGRKKDNCFSCHYHGTRW